jgi:hypothetical protein
VLLASADHELGQHVTAASAQIHLGASTQQRADFSSSPNSHLTTRRVGSEQQLQPEILEVLQSKGFKGLAPQRLRNWHRLATKLNTPGANITIVTFGGSITGVHAGCSCLNAWFDCVVFGNQLVWRIAVFWCSGASSWVVHIVQCAAEVAARTRVQRSVIVPLNLYIAIECISAVCSKELVHNTRFVLDPIRLG